MDDVPAVDRDVADLQGGGEVVRADLLGTEVRGEFQGREPYRGLVGPGGGEGALQAEEFGHPVEGAAVLPGRDEVGDAAQGVAPFQEGGDGAQPGEVVLGVPGDTVGPARWRQQAALAVEAQGSDGDAGCFGQFFHAVFAGPGAVVVHAASLGVG